MIPREEVDNISAWPPVRKYDVLCVAFEEIHVNFELLLKNNLENV